jgi:hypothetical protein
MGVVYRARQLDLDRDVALKVISPELVDDPQSRDRFLMEARAAGAVEHPNVVPVHHVGLADGQAYLVMRYVPGDDLRTIVRRSHSLGVEQSADIAAQLGDALDAIHRAGYVHRDVKPQNVMLDESGHVYLSDFGLAKHALATTGLTKSDQWVGTLDYVAPEQIRGERVDARADVYSLGGVLYFMLTGHVPFERNNDQAKLWAHLSADAPRPSALRPELPVAMDAVVQRALSKDPAQRQPSAGDLGSAARDAAGGVSSTRRERVVARGAAAPAATPHSTTVVAAPTTASAPRPPGVSKGRKRARLAYLGAALAAVAAAAIGFLPGALSPDRREPLRRPAAAESAAMGKPEGPRKGETITRVGNRPRDIVVAAGDLWVVSHARPTVTRLDAESLDQEGDQPLVGRGASDIAAYDDSIWVTVPRRGEVVRVDPRTGHAKDRVRVIEHVEPRVRPVRVAVGRSGLWVVGRAPSPEIPDVLLHYDPSGKTLLDQEPFEDGISAITLGGGAIWVALDRRPRVARLSLTGRRVSGSTLSDSASAVTYGAGHVWASLTDDDAIARVSPTRDQVRVTRAGRDPEQIAVARGLVFVASYIDDVVVVRKAKRPRQKVARLPVEANPYAMTVGAGHVWVTGVGNNTVTRLDF